MLGAGGRMKAVAKLLADFAAWRWAPAVAMLGATLLYVIIVVGLVPSEILIPVANAKFAPKGLAGPANNGTSTTSGTDNGTSLANATVDSPASPSNPTPLRTQM